MSKSARSYRLRKTKQAAGAFQHPIVARTARLMKRAGELKMSTKELRILMRAGKLL